MVETGNNFDTSAVVIGNVGQTRNCGTISQTEFFEHGLENLLHRIYKIDTLKTATGTFAHLCPEDLKQPRDKPVPL
jgi:hypothetical protein